MGGIIIRPGETMPRTGKPAKRTRKAWLEEKVQAARKGLQDGTNRVIDPEEWEEVRAAWRDRAKGRAP